MIKDTVDSYKQHLKDHPPLFAENEVVMTHKGKRMIQSVSGALKTKEGWEYQYVCCPLNVNGQPNMKLWNSKRNRFMNSFNESQLEKTTP